MTKASLARLFRSERRRFALEWPHVAGASLALSDQHYLKRPRCRDVAWAEPESGEVVLLRRVLELPRANVVGLVRHELAHVADPKASEIQADVIASIVGGKPIRYDRRGIQTIGRGGRRPRSAPR